MARKIIYSIVCSILFVIVVLFSFTLLFVSSTTKMIYKASINKDFNKVVGFFTKYYKYDSTIETDKYIIEVYNTVVEKTGQENDSNGHPIYMTSGYSLLIHNINFDLYNTSSPDDTSKSQSKIVIENPTLSPSQNFTFDFYHIDGSNEKNVYDYIQTYNSVGLLEIDLDNVANKDLLTTGATSLSVYDGNGTLVDVAQSINFKVDSTTQDQFYYYSTRYCDAYNLYSTDKNNDTYKNDLDAAQSSLSSFQGVQLGTSIKPTVGDYICEALIIIAYLVLAIVVYYFLIRKKEIKQENKVLAQGNINSKNNVINNSLNNNNSVLNENNNLESNLDNNKEEK